MSIRTGVEQINYRAVIFLHLLVVLAKLWLDGLKDVVLMPMVITAAVVDALFGTRWFIRAQKSGEAFDRRLDLFASRRQLEQRYGRVSR